MICVNIGAFRQIGIGAFTSKAKVMLILCVFSGSDVGSNWRLLYSLLHPTTKHLNNRRCSCLPCTGVNTIVNSSQLTQGGSKVRRPCQSTIVGHSDRNLRTAWFEKGDFKIGIKKKHWVDLYHYRMDVYTHLQHTFMFKQLVKWILHLMTPLKLLFSKGAFINKCSISGL